MNPENTVFDAKRLIGRKFSDPSVQSDMKHWPFQVVPGDAGKPSVRVRFKGQTKTFSPEEISAMVLTKVSLCATAWRSCCCSPSVLAHHACPSQHVRHGLAPNNIPCCRLFWPALENTDKHRTGKHGTQGLSSRSCR